MNSLPVIRSHERMDYKRCPKKWYWHWRKGYVLKAVSFGALDLGTWVHLAFGEWYVPGLVRNGSLAAHFATAAEADLNNALELRVPQHVMEKAEELLALGESMCRAYEAYYGTDPTVEVLGTEIPLEFTIPDYRGQQVAVHKLKPDMVYRDTRDGSIWLMEHKTAVSIRTEHLVIDDQARPYGAMAERALRNLGILGKHEVVKGITYNFVRKGLPDLRERDDAGKALNKDGSVSKKQPAAQFLRKPITLTKEAKRVTLMRMQREAVEMTSITQALRNGRITADELGKTPHHSCPKFCDYFAICAAEDNGIDTQEMERSLFTRQDPYAYGESTAERTSFELG